MRRLLIDTDTAADDAVALVMALEAPGRPGRGDHGRGRKRPRGPGRSERPLHPGTAR